MTELHLVALAAARKASTLWHSEGGEGGPLSAAIRAYLAALPAPDAGKWEPIVQSAKALLAKLDLIHEDASFKGAFSMMAIRGASYNGPNYAEELAALREALRALEGEKK